MTLTLLMDRMVSVSAALVYVVYKQLRVAPHLIRLVNRLNNKESLVISITPNVNNGLTTKSKTTRFVKLTFHPTECIFRTNGCPCSVIDCGSQDTPRRNSVAGDCTGPLFKEVKEVKALLGIIEL